MRDAFIARKLVTSQENVLKTKMVGNSLGITIIGKDTATEKIMIDMKDSETAIGTGTLIVIEVKGKGTGPIGISAIDATTNTADIEGLLTQDHDLTANPIGVGVTTVLNLGQRAMNAGMGNTATAGTTMSEKWGDLLLGIGTGMILEEEEIALTPVRTLALALLVDDMDTQDLIINGWKWRWFPEVKCSCCGLATLHLGGGRWSFCIFVVVMGCVGFTC